MLISIKEIAEMLKVSKSTAWEFVKLEGFPSKVQLTPRCTRWVYEEVVNWVLEHRQSA